MEVPAWADIYLHGVVCMKLSSDLRISSHNIRYLHRKQKYVTLILYVSRVPVIIFQSDDCDNL